MNYVTELFPLEFLSQEKTTECVIHSKCMTIKHKIVHGLGPVQYKSSHLRLHL